MAHQSSLSQSSRHPTVSATFGALADPASTSIRLIIVLGIE
jgi:hypothetical protein